ncbi:hypothetical protein [Endozoicomonas sp. ALB032]|uniref:hypothetical protein n=1 Tax=Endozoicomonas sp. ALB032 TaxID=3403082 RepID=UPI003BB534E4
MGLKKDNPTVFCKGFIEWELKTYQEEKIWMSYWPVMKRMLDRADELVQVFHELIEAFGYSDTLEGYPPQNQYLWLTLEHIWTSQDYCRKDVKQARNDFKELNRLQEEMIELSEQLAGALRRETELYERTGFNKADYQSITDMVELASENNYLYNSYLSKPLKSLAIQYDWKYWPSRAAIVEVISTFERAQPAPAHLDISDQVIQGRTSDIKDFVLAFDQKFDDSVGLPKDFRFSKNGFLFGG